MHPRHATSATDISFHEETRKEADVSLQDNHVNSHVTQSTSLQDDNSDGDEHDKHLSVALEPGTYEKVQNLSTPVGDTVTPVSPKNITVSSAIAALSQNTTVSSTIATSSQDATVSSTIAAPSQNATAIVSSLQKALLGDEMDFIESDLFVHQIYLTDFIEVGELFDDDDFT